MKVCKTCKQEKELTEFYYHKKLDYYSGSCKRCICDASCPKAKEKRRIAREVRKEAKRNTPVIHPEYKTCTMCSTQLPITDFIFDKRRNNYSAHCRQCQRNLVNNHYRSKTKPVFKPAADAGMKICKRCGIQKELSLFPERHDRPCGVTSICRDCYNAQAREYRKLPKYKAAHRSFQNKYYHTDLEFRERKLKRTYNYHKQRLKTDAVYALKARLRRSLSHYLDPSKKRSVRLQKILGCTDTEFLQHLGISSLADLVGNHIDHIAPLSCALTEEEVYKLNHYSNLRVIPAHENLSKSDSWTPAGAMLHLILLGREWPEPPTTEKA